MKTAAKVLGYSGLFVLGCVAFYVPSKLNARPYPGLDEEYNKKFSDWMKSNGY